ncbi:hypothetical protein L9F63_014839, partial [Diploptera punctata]
IKCKITEFLAIYITPIMNGKCKQLEGIILQLLMRWRQGFLNTNSTNIQCNFNLTLT